MHRFDPEVYLRGVFLVLPHRPRERYLELAPRYWRITRRASIGNNSMPDALGVLTRPAGERAATR